MADFDSAGFVHPQFTVVREIASSSLTRVFEAAHSRLPDRPLAIKVLRRSEHREWFLRVARTTACLCHPNIVPLCEVSEFEGTTFLALEFVPGTSLHEEIARGPKWSVTDVVQMVQHVCAALHCAHIQGFVHGRLYPRKILLPPDRVPHLIGFGEYPLPADCIYGNPTHLAPEQLQECAQATLQTDIYSLSECVFWMLTGTHPYRTENILQLWEAKNAGPTQLLGKLRPDLPKCIDSVLRKGMAPKPEDRFRSAREFAEAFAESSG
jgi:serine/threonine-protein kinase